MKRQTLELRLQLQHLHAVNAKITTVLIETEDTDVVEILREPHHNLAIVKYLDCAWVQESINKY